MNDRIKAELEELQILRANQKLYQARNQNLDAQSRLEKCSLCGKEHFVSNPGALKQALFCGICARKLQIDKLQPLEYKQLLLSVIPPKYIEAEIEHLPKPIAALIEKDIETGVYLWGDVGTGKTYAMSALAKHYLKNGYLCHRIHYELLCLQLRDTFKPASKQTELEILIPLFSVDRLFIEDVGATRGIGKEETDHSRRTLLLLLDIRLEKKLPTFITGNKSVENLEASFDERIADRIKTYEIFSMKGKSKRQPPAG